MTLLPMGMCSLGLHRLQALADQCELLKPQRPPHAGSISSTELTAQVRQNSQRILRTLTQELYFQNLIFPDFAQNCLKTG